MISIVLLAKLTNFHLNTFYYRFAGFPEVKANNFLGKLYSRHAVQSNQI